MFEGQKPQKHPAFPPGLCVVALEEVSEPLIQRWVSMLSFVFFTAVILPSAPFPHLTSFEKQYNSALV